MPQGFVQGQKSFTLVSAGTNNLTFVATGPLQVMTLEAGNVNASARFVKLFDAASNVQPTMGTDSAKWNQIIPGNTAGAGTNSPKAGSGANPAGIQFTQGLWIAVTGAIGLTDNTSISAGDVCLNIGFV